MPTTLFKSAIDFDFIVSSDPNSLNSFSAVFLTQNNSSFNELIDEGINGLVLSGGTPRIGLEDNLGNSGEYLEKANFPILGICAGHQFMGRFFGGKVTISKIPEFGKIELTILKQDVLFNKVPEKSIVWESHNDEVSELPNDFEILAKSENCKKLHGLPL